MAIVNVTIDIVVGEAMPLSHNGMSKFELLLDTVLVSMTVAMSVLFLILVRAVLVVTMATIFGLSIL